MGARPAAFRPHRSAHSLAMGNCGRLPRLRGRAWRPRRVSARLARGAPFAHDRDPDRSGPDMNAAAPESPPAISAVGLTKIYWRGREQVRALDNATFAVQPGEFI